MGFPPGMQLATVAFGIPLTATGKDVVTKVTVKPTSRVIWAATGQPLPEFSDSFTAEAGQLGQFQVPFIDQPGFIDSTGAAVTDFAFQISASWEFGNERPIDWSKNLKPLLGQSGPIDLDLVPDGPVSIPVTAPSAAVLGFGGRTGFVTLQESDLPQRLSVGDLSATYATKGEAGDKSHAITNAAIAYAPRATLQTIPTYDGSGVVVHPSVYFNPDGWNGYKYWMGMTPYTSADAALENPSIVVSQDGVTWAVPAGLTNPVEPTYPSPGNGYNSDPYLFVDGATMYLFWRTWDGIVSRDRHYYRTSTDGVIWTARTMVRDDVPATRRLVSPSYIKDANGWTVYAVDIVPTPRRIVRVKAATLAGTTTATVENVTVTGNAGDPWHIDVHKVGGEWQALVQDGGSGGGYLWAAVSNDGLNFTAGPSLIARVPGQWDAAYYKSCFVPAVKDGIAGWDAWIGGATFGASGNIIGRTFVRFDQLRIEVAALTSELALSRGEVSVIQAVNGIPPWIVGDTFARADNPTALGNANTGQTWTASSGSWKVASKAGQGQTVTNNIATIETGAVDHWANVTLTYPDTANTKTIIARYADASNFYRFGIFNGVLKLQKVVAGAATDLASPAGTISSGMSMGIRCAGSTIDLYLNNLLVATVTDAALASGTKVGMQDTTGAVRFTMFTARTS
ncbi:hypothetical protein AU252_19700 [Pseudarthrobacter sulfonivorans]|uniref:Uncharacterized protein n=1 Tax=Pseudarthrobacter sulfonivorans TaxID=121292 RepID=A0A0U2XH74_9MICC|nr:hypothetical protein [Pseudarthrobacter sulfonivorans]ALV43106.1 hypothetical protein AU252_19700 [Pseudarthrobacter sulfonivorans]